jgi:hypothetical protein
LRLAARYSHATCHSNTPSVGEAINATALFSLPGCGGKMTAASHADSARLYHAAQMLESVASFFDLAVVLRDQVGEDIYE